MRSCPRDGIPTRGDLADPLLGSVLGERYRILERIGAGGMGQVYRAAHVRIASLFAVKVLYGDLAYDPQMRGRFEREAEVASLLQSRHIVRVADFGESSTGQLYLAMEYLDGQSLADRIARVGAIEPAPAITIARQIARGLAHAHERGVVHRDLKPDNVMLVTEDDEPDVVRLLDFGLARMRSGSKLTQAGQVFGTPVYMAPEQFAGADVDARADLYAFGVMLFEMLTGAAPFECESVSDLARKHVTEVPPLLRARRPEVPAALEAIVATLLAKSPDDRFPSSRSLLDALREAVPSAVPSVASAPEPASSVISVTAVPSSVTTEIYKALVVGAPAYNEGDHAGCYEVYRCTAEDILAGVLASSEHTAARARLAVALRRAAASESPTEAAWELRHGFDDLLHGTQTSLSVRGGDGWIAGEIARLAILAAPRYAGGDLDVLAALHVEFAERFAARVREQGGPKGVADALDAAVVRARRETTSPGSLSAVTAALESIAAGQTVKPFESAPTLAAIGQCSQFDDASQRIVQAIAVGAPAYNEGDHAGCRRVYAHAAEELVASLGRELACMSIVARLERGLAAAATLDDTGAAWELRRAFDEVLAARG